MCIDLARTIVETAELTALRELTKSDDLAVLVRLHSKGMDHELERRSIIEKTRGDWDMTYQEYIRDPNSIPE